MLIQKERNLFYMKEIVLDKHDSKQSKRTWYIVHDILNIEKKNKQTIIENIYNKDNKIINDKYEIVLEMNFFFL